MPFWHIISICQFGPHKKSLTPEGVRLLMSSEEC